MNEEETPCPPQQLTTAKIVNISVVVRKAKEDRLVTFTESALHMELLHTCRTRKTDHVQKVECMVQGYTDPDGLHSLPYIHAQFRIHMALCIHTS